MSFISDLLGTKNEFQAKAPVNTYQAQLAQLTQIPGLIDAIKSAQTQALTGQGAPGSAVDASQTALAKMLTDQANGTGPSLAQGQLEQATAENAAKAAGAIASARGLNPAQAARLALTQTAAAGQQAAGQSAQVRSQEQLDAEKQLAAALSAQRSGQVAGATAAAGTLGTVGGMLGTQNQQAIQNLAQKQQINAGVAAGNQSADLQAQGINAGVASGNQQTNSKIAGGLLGGVGSVLGLAHGGEVGEQVAEVAGRAGRDDPSNDTVPIVASPEEIVLPRSIATADNAPELAAAFVAGVKSSRKTGPSHGEMLARHREIGERLAQIERAMAEGGEVPAEEHPSLLSAVKRWLGSKSGDEAASKGVADSLHDKLPESLSARSDVQKHNRRLDAAYAAADGYAAGGSIGSGLSTFGKNLAGEDPLSAGFAKLGSGLHGFLTRPRAPTAAEVVLNAGITPITGGAGLPGYAEGGSVDDAILGKKKEADLPEPDELPVYRGETAKKGKKPKRPDGGDERPMLAEADGYADGGPVDPGSFFDYRSPEEIQWAAAHAKDLQAGPPAPAFAPPLAPNVSAAGGGVDPWGLQTGPSMVPSVRPAGSSEVENLSPLASIGPDQTAAATITPAQAPAMFVTPAGLADQAKTLAGLPKPRQAGPGTGGGIQGGAALQSKGIAEEAAARGAEGEATAAAIQKGQQETDQVAQTYDAKRKELQGRLDTTRESIMNGEIDPNHYWANRSTGQKVQGVIGLVLGGIGAGLAGGPNQALEVINNAINRDIDAQKTNQQKRLQVYGMDREDMRASFADEANLRARALASVTAQVEIAKSRAQGPEAKARADQLIGALKTQTAQLVQDSALKAGQVEMQRMQLNQAREAMNLRNKLFSGQSTPMDMERAVQLGVIDGSRLVRERRDDGSTAYHMASSADDAGKVKDAIAARDEMKQVVGEARGLMGEVGSLGAWSATNKAKAEGLRARFIASAKTLAAAGKLPADAFNALQETWPDLGGTHFTKGDQQKLADIEQWAGSKAANVLRTYAR